MILIDGNNLRLEEVELVARHNVPVSLSNIGKQAIKVSNDRLNTIIQKNHPVYGINTGFGIFSDQKIDLQDASRLSRNLILSHAVGTGPALASDIVRAAMLIRANTLTKGFSGVREIIVQSILDMLNLFVTPIIPSQGSLGSSGDLCQLSHLGLILTSDEKDLDEESGFAEFDGKIMTGKSAMKQAGIPRLHLGPKEGLALNNGATFSAALAALAIVDADYLLSAANKCLALTLEALLGCSSAFDARLHEVRGLVGQSMIASQIRCMTEGSTFLDRAGRVQDAYSLRCAPQVVGPIFDTTQFVRSMINQEINAATDNPLIFEPDVALSGGNFHGEPIGMCMDYLSIAISELAAISERRIFRMTDGKLNGGLPPMLVNRPEDAGLNSGLMMPQYTAASLVLENKTLAMPDSIHSLPTSGEQEDHNANAMTAARHALEIVKNTMTVLAIELYTAARAMDLRMRQVPEAKMGKGTQEVYDKVRSLVPYQPGDSWWGPEVEIVRVALEKRQI